MKIISYNLRKNRAIGEILELSEEHETDILCLQECDTVDLPQQVGHLQLADATTSNRLGLALYFRRDRFDAIETQAFQLKKSLHDRVLSPAHERLIGTRLFDHVMSREMIAASFHAAPLTALNSLRRKQIHSALGELWTLGPGMPTIMIGDYNYPIFKGRLSNQVRESGYELTLSDKRTYTRYKFFRGHFDLATSIGFDISSIETLPRGTSDHMPILVTASYSTVPISPEDADALASPGAFDGADADAADAPTDFMI